MRRLAVLLGGVAQAALFAVLLVVVQPERNAYVVTPVVAGVVGALLSDRFEAEYIDAGGAGMVGTLLSLGVVVAVVWLNTASLPPDFRIDTTFVTVAYGLGYLLLFLPVAVIVSVVVGRLATVARTVVVELRS